MLSEREHLRALDLLADRAVQGLDATETRALGALLHNASWLDDGSFERSAAAIELAFRDPRPEPLPPFLRRRLEVEGRRLISEQAPDDAFDAAPVIPHPRGRRLRTSPWIGFATAASLVLALGWFVRYANTPIETHCILERMDRLAQDESRRELMAEEDVVRMAWSSPTDDDPHGEIVWSSGRQEGVVWVENLPAEARGSTLHLWIFRRDGAGSAIDGGAFTADAEGGAVIAVALAGESVEPLRFALTIDHEGEPPTPTEPVLVAYLPSPSTAEQG